MRGSFKHPLADAEHRHVRDLAPLGDFAIGATRRDQFLYPGDLPPCAGLPPLGPLALGRSVPSAAPPRPGAGRCWRSAPGSNPEGRRSRFGAGGRRSSTPNATSPCRWIGGPVIVLHFDLERWVLHISNIEYCYVTRTRGTKAPLMADCRALEAPRARWGRWLVRVALVATSAALCGLRSGLAGEVQGGFFIRRARPTKPAARPVSRGFAARLGGRRGASDHRPRPRSVLLAVLSIDDAVADPDMGPAVAGYLRASPMSRPCRTEPPQPFVSR